MKTVYTTKGADMIRTNRYGHPSLPSGRPYVVDGGSTFRVMGADAARAVGRFKQDGPDGYRASSAPDAPLRATREEAVADERAWLDRKAEVEE